MSDKEYYTPLNFLPAEETLAGVVGWLESFMRDAEDSRNSQPRWSDFEHVRDMVVSIQRKLLASRTRLGCFDPPGDLCGPEMEERTYDTDDEVQP